MCLGEMLTKLLKNMDNVNAYVFRNTRLVLKRTMLL